MREIEFRVWDKKEKKMYHFNKMWWDSEYQSLAFRIQEEQSGDYCFDFDVDDLTELMQYTGLKDKNGKKIFEGDIVKGSDYALIVWDKDSASFNGVDKEGTFIYTFPLTYIPKPYVVGNIYEHSELLEK